MSCLGVGRFVFIGILSGFMCRLGVRGGVSIGLWSWGMFLMEKDSVVFTLTFDEENKKIIVDVIGDEDDS